MDETVINKLFSEGFISSMIGWGELIHNEDGGSYIDPSRAPDFLNLEKWYSQFPASLLWLARIISIRALNNVNEITSQLKYDNEMIKNHMVKEIIFELNVMRHSGEINSFQRYSH